MLFLGKIDAILETRGGNHCTEGARSIGAVFHFFKIILSVKDLVHDNENRFWWRLIMQINIVVRIDLRTSILNYIYAMGCSHPSSSSELYIDSQLSRLLCSLRISCFVSVSFSAVDMFLLQTLALLVFAGISCKNQATP